MWHRWGKKILQILKSNYFGASLNYVGTQATRCLVFFQPWHVAVGYVHGLVCVCARAYVCGSEIYAQMRCGAGAQAWEQSWNKENYGQAKATCDHLNR